MSHEIATQERPAGALQDTSTSSMVFDISMIERMNELAKMMAISKVAVPAHFRGSVGDCLAVVMQSVQWGMNPFAVAQKTFCISGVLGYEAQLVNAVIAARAPVTGRIEYEWFGPWERVIGKFAVKKNADGKEYRTPNWTAQDEEGCGVKVWATFKGEQQPRELELLLTQARTRNSTLWADDPRQQLAYLAVKRWSRLYCPDVILGVYTPDELTERGEVFMGEAEEVLSSTPALAESKSSTPASRADKARAALVKSKPVALPAPALAEVLTTIRLAPTMEALQAAAEVARGLETDTDKAAARAAYSERKAELFAATVDNETGEIADAGQQQHGEHDDFLRGLDQASGQ